MTQRTETNIRTRPDGSIDTAHYMARGRRLRSEQAHRLLGLNQAPTDQSTRAPFWAVLFNRFA